MKEEYLHTVADNMGFFNVVYRDGGGSGGVGDSGSGGAGVARRVDNVDRGVGELLGDLARSELAADGAHEPSAEVRRTRAANRSRRDAKAKAPAPAKTPASDEQVAEVVESLANAVEVLTA